MTVETKIASLIKNNNRAALIRMASKYQEKGIKNMNKRDLATLVASNVVETEVQVKDREQAIDKSTVVKDEALAKALAPDPFDGVVARVKSFFSKIFS